MLRKSGLFWAAAMLLSGCEFFSTREFRPKPPEIRSLQGLSKAGDSVSFRVTESLFPSDAGASARVVSVKRLVFRFLKDSLDGGDSLKSLSLRITDDSTGALLENSVRVVRFNGDGAILEGSGPEGGARYFPLKTTASGAAITTADAAVDSGDFLALPAFFVQGWSESQILGVLQVRRELTMVDTLEYQDHLEEAWGITETVLDGNATLAQGLYLYGSSGLLRAEQTWTGFDWRDGNGAMVASADLRRVLERL